jgi:hypothetical protein
MPTLCSRRIFQFLDSTGFVHVSVKKLHFAVVSIGSVPIPRARNEKPLPSEGITCTERSVSSFKGS